MRRWTVLVLATLWTLGCGGSFNGLAKLAGLDAELAMGSDAVHPADFPSQPPAGAERTMSMAITAPADSLTLPEGAAVQLSAGSYRMETVAYRVPVDQVTNLANIARDQAVAAGYVEQSSQPQANGNVVNLTSGPNFFLVIAGTEDSEATLVLVRLTPSAAEAAPTE